MAAGIVSLLGPDMPTKSIRTWTDRELLDFYNPKPGSNNPRLYSLANAIQLHTMYIMTFRGLSVQQAIKIGKAAQVYTSRLIESGTFDTPNFFRNSVHFVEKYEEIINTKMFYWGHPGQFCVGFFGPEQMIQNLRSRGDLLETGKGSRIHIGVIQVGGLVLSILYDFLELDPELNQLALEGRLKPFPTSLG